MTVCLYSFCSTTRSAVAISASCDEANSMAFHPPMQWSSAIEDLYREHVSQKVQNDRRTDWDGDRNISLGFPFRIICDDVLEKGRADFTKGYEDDEYGTLTEDDKVLLYCFVFMKRHF